MIHRRQSSACHLPNDPQNDGEPGPSVRCCTGIQAHIKHVADLNDASSLLPVHVEPPEAPNAFCTSALEFAMDHLHPPTIVPRRKKSQCQIGHSQDGHRPCPFISQPLDGESGCTMTCNPRPISLRLLTSYQKLDTRACFPHPTPLRWIDSGLVRHQAARSWQVAGPSSAEG